MFPLFGLKLIGMGIVIDIAFVWPADCGLMGYDENPIKIFRLKILIFIDIDIDVDI